LCCHIADQLEASIWTYHALQAFNKSVYNLFKSSGNLLKEIYSGI